MSICGGRGGEGGCGWGEAQIIDTEISPVSANSAYVGSKRCFRVEGDCDGVDGAACKLRAL